LTFKGNNINTITYVTSTLGTSSAGAVIYSNGANIINIESNTIYSIQTGGTSGGEIFYIFDNTLSTL
jgi:hypothetical protein